MNAKSTIKPTGTPTPDDIEQYPFLCKTLITFTQTNEGGVEQKRKEEVVFKLDAEGGRMPWYVLRNYLVPRYLKKHYGPKEVGWQRVYEIKIVKQVNRKQPDDINGIPLRIMTMDQLELYCKRWDLNVPVREFYSVEKAREMVNLRLEDESGYKKHLAEYREGKQRHYPELDSMRGAEDVEVASADEFDAIDVEPKTTTRRAPGGKKKVKTKDNAEAVDEETKNPFQGM